MLLLIGAVVVLLSVFGGYAAMGAHLAVLWQPFEGVIILGAAIGSYLIGNPMQVIKGTGSALGSVFKGSRYNKESYLELLSLLYSVFRLAKQKGPLALEQHVENPSESDLFQRFPTFAADHHAVEFLCDYLRLITLDTETAHEMEQLMDEELETHHEEQERQVTAIQTIADATPALGIVAAVLGVIKTMGAINQPPEILGHLIGGALVGTFLGVFCAYGFFGPMAQSLKMTYAAETKYLQAIKAGLLAHVSGYAPAVSVEFARKALLSEVRPTFYEVEEATQNLSPAA